MQWNAKISESYSRKQILLWILNSKMQFGLQENISFTWRDSISLYPGDFDRLTLSSVWIMSLALPSVWRAVHTPYSLNEDQTSSSFDFTLTSLCVCVRLCVCVCVCMNVSIISVPVQVCQLHFSSAPLFFLNVIVECSSEMNLHTCILTEGNTIGYILLTPCVVCLFNIQTFLPERSSSLQLNTNTLRE